MQRIPIEHIRRVINEYRPRFNVGRVQTSSQQARVEITGEWPNYTIHFEIPRGQQGPQGIPGETRGTWLDPALLQNPYGAKIRIEQELNANKICLLPPGTFSLAQPIQIDSDQCLIGAGMGGFATPTILKPAPGYTGALIESKGFGSRCILRAHIKGIWFDGSDTTLTAIRLNCRESSITDVMVRACHTYGVWIGGISSDAATGLALNNIVQNVKMFPGTTARYWVGMMEDYYSADNRFLNLYVEGCREACLESRGANALVHECHFYKCEQEGGSKAYGVVFRDSGEKYLTDCYIENVDGNGLYIAGGSSQADIIVSGNIFRNIRRKNTSQLPGDDRVISWQSPPINCLITGNVVRRDNSSFRQVGEFTGEAPGVIERDNVWSDAVVGRPTLNLQVKRIAGSTTLVAGRQYLYTGGNATLTLPNGTVGDWIQVVRFVDASTVVTLTPNSGQKIDGSTSNLNLTGKGTTSLYYLDDTVGWRSV